MYSPLSGKAISAHSSHSATVPVTSIDDGHTPTSDCSGAGVDTQPGIERQPVVAHPARVPLRSHERVARLQRRSHRSDEIGEAMLGADAPHLVQGDAAEPGAATLLRDEDLQCAEEGWRDVVVDRRAQRLPPAVRRELVGIERDGNAVHLDQELVRRHVEPPELELARNARTAGPSGLPRCRRGA